MYISIIAKIFLFLADFFFFICTMLIYLKNKKFIIQILQNSKILIIYIVLFMYEGHSILKI